MKKSENYEMNLPEGTDAYDVEHMNENVEKIDELLKENADNYKKHLNDKENPHKVTAKQLGLDKVNNTPDEEKNVKYATKANQDNNGNVIHDTYATKAENEETVVSNTITGKNVTATDSTDAPIISQTINGFTKQDGTPTPDAPIEIEGLDKVSVKTCGKNLLNYDEWKKATCKNGSIVWENNGVTITAFRDDAYTQYYHDEQNDFPSKINVIEGEEYTLSWEESSDAVGHIYVFGQNNQVIAFQENEKAKKVTFTIPSGITQISYRFGVINANVTISYKNIQIEKGSVATDYEPYTETLAEIDLAEPLYEGDYIEYRADGTGVLHRSYCRIKQPFTINKFYNNSIGIKLPFYGKDAVGNNYSNYFVIGRNWSNGQFQLAENAIGAYSHIYATIDGLTTLNEYKTWLNEHQDIEFVYELTTPQEIELTAEQLAQFKNLRTFETTTNIISNGETTTQYYKANENGEAVGGLQERVENIENTRAVRVNGNAKQIYGDGVEGSMEVSRFQLDEKTYLVDIKVTLTKIPETLSGNGPSIDLSLSDLGFDSEASAYESMCILSSYYPIITNGGNYCLGGGMCSTDNFGRGFYFSFLPHKNTKGSISSVNTSVLAGCMMIRLQ